MRLISSGKFSEERNFYKERFNLKTRKKPIKAKDKIRAEVRGLWPECPKEFLKDAFFASEIPTAEMIVAIGSFAVDCGTDYGNAYAFNDALQLVREQEVMILSELEHDPEHHERVRKSLLEIRRLMTNCVFFASEWTKPKSVFHHSHPWELEPHLMTPFPYKRKETRQNEQEH